MGNFDKKKMVWAIISLVIAALTIWTITSQSKNFSLEQVRAYLEGGNPFWIACALLSMFGFIWFEGLAIVRAAKVLGYDRNIRQGTLYGAADVYFSSITPSATGGQPASAFFMLRDKMPMTAITTVLLINLIMYTLALLSLGLLSLIFRFDLFLSFSLISKFLIGLGCGILLALGVCFYFLLRKAELLYRFCNWGIDLLHRLHLMRHADKRKQKLNQTMTDYENCAKSITGHIPMLIQIYFLNVMQRASQLGVSFFIFMALGKSFREALEVAVLQCFVAMGSNSVPIPGAMGVADYIMLDGFKGLMPLADVANYEMLCRGMTFYLCIVTSASIVLVSYFLGKHRRNTK